MLMKKDKTVFVSIIKKKKDILFGAFLLTLTKDMKDKHRRRLGGGGGGAAAPSGKCLPLPGN